NGFQPHRGRRVWKKRARLTRGLQARLRFPTGVCPAVPAGKDFQKTGRRGTTGEKVMRKIPAALAAMLSVTLTPAPAQTQGEPSHLMKQPVVALPKITARKWILPNG